MLTLIVILLVIIFVIGASQNSKNGQKSSPEARLDQRNQEWVSFIAGYMTIAKSKAEKQLLARMLNDIREQNLVDEDFAAQFSSDVEVESPSEKIAPSPVISAEIASMESVTETVKPPQKTAQDIKLDNISLLLYFGAFLLVASAGLFVAFADIPGVLRTFVVGLVAFSLYGAGLWMYENKKALQPAGLAFAGIGMSIAPLIGVAAYNFMLPNSPELVWLLTSLLCVGLYAHALFTLRKPLINYILIFTMLSLFESSISVVKFPIYYFGWGMALVGIAMQAVAQIKNIWPDFQESSRNSSHLFLPVALFISFVLVGSHGVGQLGISSLLAGCFYLLETSRSSGSTQQVNATVSQVSFLAGVSCLVYAISGDAMTTGGVLGVLAALQTLVILQIKETTKLIYNFASVVLVSGVVSLTFFWQNYMALCIGIACLTTIGLLIWYKQSRDDAYGIAALGWIALPIVYGQLVLAVRMSPLQQSILVIAGLFLHVLLFIGVMKTKPKEGTRDALRAGLILNIIAATVVALFAGPVACLGALLAVSVMMLPLSIYDDSNFWSIISGFVISLAVWRNAGEKYILPIALFVALAYNIGLSLRFRSEPNRWLSAILWLFIPLGIGAKYDWAGEYYAWAYVIVMVALVISRAIARGVAFTSTKIPIAAYAKNASLSYVFGYVSAGGLGLLISLSSDTSRIHTSLILAVISLFVFITAWGVEKRSDIMALQPLLWQALLLSIIRPALQTGSLEGYLLLSTILGGFCYAASSMFVVDETYKKFISPDVVKVSLLTTYIVPASVMFGESVWVMPFGLMIAGAVTYDYVRTRTQEYREVAAAVMVGSVLWFMSYFGVHEFQAYTHVIALMFAGFAYWRALRNENKESDNYLYVMLSVATIPLVLQAISGVAGGLYGWWLLIEQVLFMMLGVTIRRRFVTMWGLYVAIGSVLYQLRNLGWAALTVLAMFIIGVAIYQLQKYNKPDQ